jgi:hypothetical protein
MSSSKAVPAAFNQCINNIVRTGPLSSVVVAVTHPKERRVVENQV